jgi:diguanylate cyclase (GGDEF)-like protein
MEGIRKYDISFSGGFVDKTMEREFFHYDMKCCSKFIGHTALIFGVIYMLFIIADYFAIDSPFSFMTILVIRILFLMASIIIYFCIKKINDYSNLAYLITAYEIWAIISFMVIIYQYGSIGLMSFFSVMAITLAVYIMPNRLINAQIISIFFNLSFFVLYANHVEDMKTDMLLKVIMYDLIFIIFGNIEAYLTNFYKRKQFADSRELLRLSITDSITGIYNRARFDQELNRWIDYCNRNATPLSLVMLDIDDFKKVNDNFGHLIGDSVLQNITSVIKSVIRCTDIFARWGGDELVILLPSTDIRQAMEMTERIRICIQKNKHDIVGNVTCSFGLVSLQKSENAETLLKRADEQLYDAKVQGKNIISYEAIKIEEQVKSGTYIKCGKGIR